jgi:renalase
MTATSECEPCVVVGAGLAGLMAARTFQDSGVTALVVERSQVVGGRLATARFASGVFDHGSQYFTARHWRFQRMVEQWVAAGIVKEWSRGFMAADGVFPNDRYARYRAVNGMDMLARHLAHGLNVRLGATVVSVAWRGDFWELRTDRDEETTARALILTPPLPHSLALLDAGRCELPTDVRETLEGVTYSPCIAVLAVLDGAARLPAPGGIRVGGEPLEWIADNSRKGVSPGAVAVTIHAGPEYSRVHMGDSDAQITETIIEAARPWIGDAPVRASEVRRWEHSRVVRALPVACLVGRAEPPLVFAGDAFGGPRMEGAVMSGLAAAERVLEKLPART